MIDYFVEHRDEAVLGLFGELGMELKRFIDIELKPAIALPGKQILSGLEQKIAEQGGQIICGEVTGINTTGKGIEISYGCHGDQNTIHADKLVVATGGRSHIFQNTTGLRGQTHNNIVDMLHDGGIATENRELMFEHPILIDSTAKQATIGGTGYPNRRIYGLVSPEFTATCDFYTKDKSGKIDRDFLPPALKQALANSTYLTEISSLVDLFKQCRAEGKEVIMSTRMDQAQLEHFVKNDSYGWMFRGLHVDQIKELTIQPGMHYSLGGLKINSDMQSTTNPNIYAVGEAAAEYGFGRKRGFGHLDAIVLGPKLAKGLVHTLCEEKQRTSEPDSKKVSVKDAMLEPLISTVKKGSEATL